MDKINYSMGVLHIEFSEEIQKETSFKEFDIPISRIKCIGKGLENDTKIYIGDKDTVSININFDNHDQAQEYKQLIMALGTLR